MNAPLTRQSPALYYYRRLLAYAWQYRLVFFISVLALACFSLSNAGFLAGIKMVTDHGFVNKDRSWIGYLPWLIFLLLSLRAVAGFVANFSMRWVARRVVEKIRLDVFSRLMTLPVRFFDSHSVGVVVSKLTYDVEQVANASTKVVISAVRDSLTIIAVSGYMLYINWKLTLIVLATLPFIGYYLYRMTPLMRESGRSVQESVGEMTCVLEESVSGQRVVKIFGGETYESRRFEKGVALNRRMQIRLARISGINSMIIEIIASLGLTLIVFYAMGEFSAGEFASFVGALLMLIAPIKALTNLNEEIQTGVAAAQSVFILQDEPQEADWGSVVLPRARGDLELRNIHFKYERAKRLALKNVSMVVRAGEKVALVGRSGSGKSSLISLLARFYDPQRGEILLDGQNIQSLSLASLRQQFALVSQDVVLFNDTVANNVAYGTLQHMDTARIISALKSAHAWEFVEQMPDGLYSVVGDRGVRLSGGQKQRLAIARAILKNAPVLLLDEATSALDSESEKHVQEALDELMVGRTTLIVAHRLSTVLNADRIVVTSHGEIVESGTHEVLMAAGGYYAQLYKKQFR